MTTALLESPLPLFGETRRPEPAGGRPTLEDRLEAAWRAGRADGRADCPVCSAAMSFDRGAGRCASCGSTLS